MPKIVIDEKDVMGSGIKPLDNSISMIYIPAMFKGMNIRWYALGSDQL